MKKVILSLAMVATLFIYSSCNKIETTNDAVADVFNRSLKYNGSDAYKTVYSVVSFSPMASVSVETPDGVTFDLSENVSTGQSFYKDTAMTGGLYSFEPAIPGEYTFDVTFKDGQKKVLTNILTDKNLTPPVIDSLYRKTDGRSVRIKWSPVGGASAYQIRISSGNNEILPWVGLTASQNYFERIISNFSHWLPGTITFEVRAAIYETNPEYVQAMSISSRSIEL